MKNKKDEKWLDEKLSSAVDFGHVNFDPEKWKEKYILSESSKQSKIKLHKEIRRFIMKSKVTKYSVAAVFVFAFVLVLLNPFGGSKNGGIVWAEVLDKVSQMHTIIVKEEYLLPLRMDGDEPNVEAGSVKIDVTEYVSEENGVVLEAFNGNYLIAKGYFLKNTKQYILVFYALEGYVKAPMDGDIFDRIALFGAPRGMMEYFASSNYAELGQAKYDNFDVEGFETSDPNVLFLLPESLRLLFPVTDIAGRIWIDLKTSLPVGVEVEFNTDKGVLTELKKLQHCKYRAYDFQWNAELPQGIYEPNIPEGYRELKDTDFMR